MTPGIAYRASTTEVRQLEMLEVGRSGDVEDELLAERAPHRRRDQRIARGRLVTALVPGSKKETVPARENASVAPSGDQDGSEESGEARDHGPGCRIKHDEDRAGRRDSVVVLDHGEPEPARGQAGGL